MMNTVKFALLALFLYLVVASPNYVTKSDKPSLSLNGGLPKSEHLFQSGNKTLRFHAIKEDILAERVSMRLDQVYNDSKLLNDQHAIEPARLEMQLNQLKKSIYDIGDFVAMENLRDKQIDKKLKFIGNFVTALEYYAQKRTNFSDKRYIGAELAFRVIDIHSKLHNFFDSQGRPDTTIKDFRKRVFSLYCELALVEANYKLSENEIVLSLRQDFKKEVKDTRDMFGELQPDLATDIVPGGYCPQAFTG
ncbi:hypothetical protein OXX80_004241 [Metschnikowia pulcherrima]